MRLLVDTHVLLWTVAASRQLTGRARAAIASDRAVVYVSIASLWELQIKQSIKKLTLPDGFFSKLPLGGFEVLDLSVAHIEAYGKLPLIHRDPFDRILVAQASIEGLTLVTRDPDIIKYDIQTLRA